MRRAAYLVCPYQRIGKNVSLITGGGGGWGDPKQRDPERVLRDVQNEYVTLGQALEIYGVAIDGKTLEIDWEKTVETRGKGEG